jgi:hypothetical protein
MPTQNFKSQPLDINFLLVYLPASSPSYRCCRESQKGTLRNEGTSKTSPGGKDLVTRRTSRATQLVVRALGAINQLVWALFSAPVLGWTSG